MNMHFAAGATARVIVANDLEAQDTAEQTFASDVLAGLTHQPKYLAPKYFYDAAGSELFEQITRLPEYYPTRTELCILRDHGADIAACIPEGAALIEFGAGATTKVRLLLDRANRDAAQPHLSAYVPVDISGDFLNSQAHELRKHYPRLDVHPIVADFTAPFDLPVAINAMPRVGFFPGSTLGNFEPHEACAFLRSARDILGHDAHLVIGIDLEKDASILKPAYDDAAGVTARFNLNLLTRINRELGGDFDLSTFAHQALFNRERHRVEMHLVSKTAQTVHVCGQAVAFRRGESIHTENSYKYSLERFGALTRGSGWATEQSWTDASEMFSVHVLRAE